jgi:hypothetical protein
MRRAGIGTVQGPIVRTEQRDASGVDIQDAPASHVKALLGPWKVPVT